MQKQTSIYWFLAKVVASSQLVFLLLKYVSICASMINHVPHRNLGYRLHVSAQVELSSLFGVIDCFVYSHLTPTASLTHVLGTGTVGS